MSERKKALMRRMTTDIWFAGEFESQNHCDLHELFACLVATEDPEEMDGIQRAFEAIMRGDPITWTRMKLDKAKGCWPNGGER